MDDATRTDSGDQRRGACGACTPPWPTPVACAVVALMFCGMVATHVLGLEDIVTKAAYSALFQVTLVYAITRMCKARQQTTQNDTGYERLSSDIDERVVDVADDDAREEEEDACEQPVQRPPRQLYLDVCKAALTALVVLHHCTCVFANNSWYVLLPSKSSILAKVTNSVLAINQSFFMSCFFFISGLNTWSSLRRKGAAAFLSDRFWRIGLPLLVFSMAVSPACQTFVEVAIARRPRPGPYQANPGVCWYLFWLLLFSTSASLFDSARFHSSAPPPSTNLRIYVGAGAILGFVQIFQLVFLTGGSFFSMPLTIGSLTMDVPFFCLACVAGNHDGWIDSFVERIRMRRATIHLANVALASFCVISIALLDLKSLWGSVFSIAIGVQCVTMSMGVLDLSRAVADLLGDDSAWLKFFASHAYAVYLVHTPVINATVLAVAPLIEWWQGSALAWSTQGVVSANITDANVAAVAYVIVVVVAQAGSWSFAWFFRTYVPYVRHII